MKAYVLISIRPGEIPEAVRQLRQVKGVTEVSATFGPYDAVAVIESTELKDIARLVAWDIQVVAGVAETLTCLVMEGT
jgi:DNA-binding Lrp family transcriptional regulator